MVFQILNVFFEPHLQRTTLGFFQLLVPFNLEREEGTFCTDFHFSFEL